MTSPAPSLKANAVALSLEESNTVPSGNVPVKKDKQRPLILFFCLIQDT